MKIALLEKRPQLCAFSLIELLVVIAIMLVLMGVSLPVYVQVAKAIRITNATQLVVDEIQVARATALARGVPVEMCIIKTVNDGKVIYSSLRTRLVESGSASWTGPTHSLPEGIVFSAAEKSNIISMQSEQEFDSVRKINGVRLRFYPSGKAELSDSTGGFQESAFLTMGQAGEIEESLLPKNFATVQVNLKTGRIATYRP